MVSSSNGGASTNGTGMGIKRAETTIGAKIPGKPRRNTVQLGNGFNHI